MQISKIIKRFIDYYRLNSKKNTIRNYAFVLYRFDTFSRSRQFEQISPDDILSFLIRLSRKSFAAGADIERRPGCLSGDTGPPD